MKNYLVIFTGFFCLGIIFITFIKIYFFFIYPLAIFLLIVCLLAYKKRIFILLSCFVFFLIGALLTKEYYLLPKTDIVNLIFKIKNNPNIIKGVISSNPSLKNGGEIFIFKVQELQFDKIRQNCCGNILVYVKGVSGLHYGDGLLLCGKIYRPYGGISSGSMSYRDYLFRQGIHALMNVKNSAKVTQFKKGNSSLSINSLAFWLKNKCESAIYQYLDGLPAAVLDAMVLGEKKDISRVISNSMIKSGTIHILVVSGFNVGIVSFIIFLILKIFRLPRRVRIFITGFLLLIYCLMTGSSTPVIRATIMGEVFLFSYFLKRESDIYNSLSLAVMIILAINPLQLYDIGFQLSFVSVISIVSWYPRLKSFLRLEKVKNKLLKFFSEGMLVSFSAWLGTAGFIAYYFKIICPITIIANIFIVPLASLITLCGFSLIFSGLIFPSAANIFASASKLLILILLNLNNFLINLPGAYFLI